MSTKIAGMVTKNCPQSEGRTWVTGFLLVGMMLGLFGSLQIAWQYHLSTDARLIGLHFLALNAGFVLAAGCAQRTARRFSPRALTLVGCALSLAGFVLLYFVAPPAPVGWRLLGLALLGSASGTLIAALLYALESCSSASLASTINRAALLFGGGSFLATLIVGATYAFPSTLPLGIDQLDVMLMALVSCGFFLAYARSGFLPDLRATGDHRHHQPELTHDTRKIAVVLFSLLLFFQFGNEWAIAGWLPEFLIHRLGASPVLAIFALAVYFLALLLGRWAIQPLLPRVSSRVLLLAGTSAAMCGYLVLSFSSSVDMVWPAVIVIGAGFAPIYPLVAQTLDERFTYRPGFYNGIFSIALTGAMSAPWLLGYVDVYLGIRYVMLLPALGSIAVLVLLLLIMLEAHTMGSGSARDARQSVTTSGQF